jgi:hypothetical protein
MLVRDFDSQSKTALVAEPKSSKPRRLAVIVGEEFVEDCQLRDLGPAHDLRDHHVGAVDHLLTSFNAPSIDATPSTTSGFVFPSIKLRVALRSCFGRHAHGNVNGVESPH